MIRAILLLLCFATLFVEIPSVFWLEVCINIAGAIGIIALTPMPDYGRSNPYER